ncbi:hypothetical protein ACTQ32_14470 [Roseburia faecis]|uniref:hypothetical protein n=1 Tax=Roseburia faecis TaxID=301302 RepID=UPI003F944B29
MYDKISEIKNNMKRIIRARGMTRSEKYTQIKQLNQSLSSTEQNILIKELHRDCDYYNTLSDIKEIITIGLMGFPLLLSIYSLWVDRNGIKFSDYTSTLKYILVFNIFCLFIFVITSTLKNHWVNNAKYLLDILGDE